MTMCNINEHPCDCFDCKMASICHGTPLQFEMNQDRYYMAPWEPSYIIYLVTMVNMGYHTMVQMSCTTVPESEVTALELIIYHHCSL